LVPYPTKALVEPRPMRPLPAVTAVPAAAEAARSDIGLSLHEDIDALEPEWRRFELHADATVFQSFDWLSLWHRHIGARAGVRTAVVLGRSRTGELMFLLPLAVVPGLVRRLTFLGEGLCDYHAPLLAPDFAARVTADAFVSLWRDALALLRTRPHLRHDLIELTNMPETVGAQPNPLLRLDVRLTPSGAYSTELAGSWDEFYAAKRSSATRRRDRTKLKRLAEHGEIRFVDPTGADDIARTVAVLIEQKSRAFARMGVHNIFSPPGWREFYLDLATNPRTRHLAHVSRLEVGDTIAAANLGLTGRGTYYHILTSYHDGELARFGPGVAHLRELMRRAIEQGFTRFDFTIGDERYKLDWYDTEMKLYDHVAAATPRGWPAMLLLLGFRRLKRAIKQNPTLWGAFTRARATLGALRRRGHGACDGGRAADEE